MLEFFENLFGKKTKKAATIDNVVTAPLSDVQLQSIKALAQNHFEPLQFLVASG